MRDIRTNLDRKFAVPSSALGALKINELRIKDRNGVSVLQHLAEEATQDPGNAMQLVGALGTFGGSTQDNHATCATETISFLLDHTNVGEWVRMVRDLQSTDGTELVDPRTGERVTMKAPPDAFWPDRSGNRGALDQVMQASIKSLVAPPGTTYSNRYDQFICTETGKARRNGLSDDQAAKALTLLTGIPHTDIDDRVNLETVINKFDGQPLFAALKWGQAGQAHESHAVAVTEIKNDRVYFRNPWGPSEDRSGTELKNPRRRVEDNKTGLESMSKSDFLNLLDGAVISEQRFNSMLGDVDLSDVTVRRP